MREKGVEMLLRVILNKKKDKSEKFSFIVPLENADTFFDYFFRYFDNFEDVLITFEKIEEEKKEK